MLVQCLIKVSDMFMMKNTNEVSTFGSEVKVFLEQNDIRALADINLIGKSKLSTKFDFGIGKSLKASERLIKVRNGLDLSTTKNIIFSWEDTKEVREESSLFVFLNDREKSINMSHINGLSEYGIHSCLWSKRNEYIEILSA